MRHQLTTVKLQQFVNGEFELSDIQTATTERGKITSILLTHDDTGEKIVMELLWKAKMDADGTWRMTDNPVMYEVPLDGLQIIPIAHDQRLILLRKSDQRQITFLRPGDEPLSLG